MRYGYPTKLSKPRYVVRCSGTGKSKHLARSKKQCGMDTEVSGLPNHMHSPTVSDYRSKYETAATMHESREQYRNIPQAKLLIAPLLRCSERHDVGFNRNHLV